MEINCFVLVYKQIEESIFTYFAYALDLLSSFITVFSFVEF